MLLLYVVVALITLGLVLPCVLDIAMTPRYDFGLPSKQTWLMVVLLFWVFGAAAWLLVGRKDIRLRQLWFDIAGGRTVWTGQAYRPHPASRASHTDFEFADAIVGRVAGTRPTRFVAPDDDPDFLQELERRIREERDGA